MHYGEHVRRQAIRRPTHPAIIDRDLRLTYQDLDQRSDRLANAWHERGLERGDRVALLVDNGHVAVEALVAACKAGLVHVPLDFRLAPHDVAAIVDDAGARAMIVGQAYLDTFAEVRDVLDLDVLLHVGGRLEGAESYEQALATSPVGPRRVDVVGSDDFCILYTSGTTGRAKGVVFDHDQTAENAMAVMRHYDIDERVRYIVSYPHSSAGSVNHVIGPVLMTGGTLILDEVKAFSAERYFDLVERHQATNGQLVPTMLFRLLESEARERFDLSSLRTLGYASAPIPPSRVEQMLAAFGPILVHAYGMTETCSIATVLSKRDHEVVGTDREHVLQSCGRATYGIEVRIVDDEGRDVPIGEVGEIAMRGRWLTHGYWNDPTRTAETIRDGWLYSGDLGRMDREEYVYIVDRKKDLIITGGANVASTEVEAAIYRHPAVAEVAVVGVADEEWGERIHAVVACVAGADVTIDELSAHCRRHLAGFKRPKSFEIRDELPKTSTGKLAKSVLREELH